MQNNPENQPEIKCPLRTILIIFIIKCFGYLGLFAYGNILSILLDFLVFIVITLSVYWAYKGMTQKKFYLYKRALIISLIISIISTIFRIISIINVINVDARTDEVRTAKIIVLVLYIIGIFFDWAITMVLILYRKRIENYCETAPNLPNLNTNNTPLV